MMLAGAVVIGTHFFGAWAKPREIVFELRRPSDIRTLDVRWTPDQDPEPEGLSHVAQWNFGPEGAPRSVRSTIPLKGGAYLVDIHVVRGDVAHDTRRKVVVDDADSIELPID